MKNKKLFVSFLIVTLLSVFLPSTLAYGEDEVLACSDANADSIITVYADGTGECATIQEAIDVAVDGDTVQVYAGTYYESLEITGKSITVSGDVDDPASVIVDPNYLGRGFYVHDVVGDAVIVEGLTVQNGRSTTDVGAGINVFNAGLGVSNCVFTNNEATSSGGAITLISITTDSYIEKSKFYSNRSSSAGGAISLSNLGDSGSNVTIKNNLIYENESVTQGGGVYIGIGGYAYLFNNTFVANKADKDGGAVYIYADAENTKVQNNIFYDNKADYDGNSDANGGAIFFRNYIINSVISYNDFYANDENDLYVTNSYKSPAAVSITNQTYNPSFTDLANDDYTLTSNSMLIDLGIDLGEEGVSDDFTGKFRPVDGDVDDVFAYDIGAYEYGDVISNDDTEDEISSAQTYCEENSGTYETRTYESGDPYYMCVFADTSECDAELFYAGLCAVGDSLTTEDQDDDTTSGDDDTGDADEVACGDFPDVDSANFTDEQCSAITWVQTEGIFTGNDGTGELLPADEINRAETTKVLIEAFGFDSSETESTYSDLVSDAWYIPYIMAATEAGIVEGYSDGTFKPESTVNKVEMLKIILETADVDLSGVDISQEIFTDVPVDESTEWYRPYVYFAYENGLVDVENDSEQIRASLIMIGWDEIDVADTDRTKEEAYSLISEILEKVNNGEDFSELATIYSEDSATSSVGGDLGFFGKGEMVSEFEDVAFATPEGEISDVFETEFGYMILKVTDSRPSGEFNPADGMLREDAILALYRLAELGYY